MGLTHSSVGKGAYADKEIGKSMKYVAALAGNPNVGKSSLFNALTGLDQHTGNWTGKTVATAVGHSQREDITFVDLPGTYSLRSHSPEEEVARDFMQSDRADVTVVVCDATSLERSLSLALQIIELTQRVVVCVNLIDEAKKRGITVDTDILSSRLGVPVVSTSARSCEGLEKLCSVIRQTAESLDEQKIYPLTYPPKTEEKLSELAMLGYSRAEIIEQWLKNETDDPILADAKVKLSADGNFEEMLLTRPIIISEGIACEAVSCKGICGYSERDRKIDRIVTHPILSIPLMLLMLAGVFYLTIIGSNYPSAALQSLFDALEAKLYLLADILPDGLRDLLVLGMARTLFRVVAVMLPPMAIFFPLFTLMEDLGLLGRIAFNLDGAFYRCSACGKQALTMCMGLGCNAAGVVGCRIIDSPRERFTAILTNSFMPCNGRFPILITVSALLCTGIASRGIGALVMLAAVVGGVFATLFVSKILSVTILKGVASSFTLELPSYRKPQIGKLIVRSIFDRTLFVLGRAAAVAAPAGIVIWLLANVYIGEMSLFSHITAFFDPLGQFIGLDGVVICAFILGFPANEIVLPLILMGYTSAGVLGTDSGIAAILAANGWGTLQYINMLILTVFHFPCSTTVLTVKKETGSYAYTVLSMLIPTLIGIILCSLTHAVSSLI